MSKLLRDLADVYYGKSPNEVISDESVIPIIGTGGVYGRATRAMYQGPAVVVPRKGSLGNPQFIGEPFWAADTTYAVLPKPKVDAKWLYYSLAAFDLTKLNEATGVPSINRDWLYRIKLGSDEFDGQRRIAEVLSTVDEAIEQTEALTAKYQQIKTGLMHDLFTRGVTPDGQLRPTYKQAPHLYKESPLGWIPKEWGLVPIGNLAESVADGPFGSNLKTEHYVIEPGVRVVRLQNVQDGQYNDSDRAFIAESHANFLARNQVIPGDVLIAGLGEDNNVVGRACCYPEGFPTAINKADCFRLRCISLLALNRFVMYFLNTFTARYQVRRFEQGVTRRRINTGNLKRVCVALPSKSEQVRIVSILDNAVRKTEATTEYQAKLRQQKHGLMQDLLSGRVKVEV
ncbi:MAG: restriction endonuclease subunit S [Nitrospiraceae bacterium]